MLVDEAPASESVEAPASEADAKLHSSARQACRNVSHLLAEGSSTSWTVKFVPSAIIYLMKLEVEFGFLGRDDVTQKVDKPGWRAQKLHGVVTRMKTKQEGASG